ncbi:MAG: hypothetical protein M0P57_00570 [Syntrophales bacterium]|nr:hypothetical protein [Syntrophales bacterium]MDY0043680.1 MauE/DoxX family redox-associated membrane protein [Syntrophales bacterium]
MKHRNQREELYRRGIDILLGALFLYASIHKIIDPESFAVAIYNYRILPFGLINIAAVILPWLELAIGLCLFFRVWYFGAVLLADLLLSVFFLALLISSIRGIDIQCGCFSTSNEVTLAGSMLWYLIRDGLLLFLGIYLFIKTFAAFSHVKKGGIKAEKSRQESINGHS